jgi:hypothetical protein
LFEIIFLEGSRRNQQVETSTTLLLIGSEVVLTIAECLVEVQPSHEIVQVRTVRVECYEKIHIFFCGNNLQKVRMPVLV